MVSPPQMEERSGLKVIFEGSQIFHRTRDQDIQNNPVLLYTKICLTIHLLAQG